MNNAIEIVDLKKSFPASGHGKKEPIQAVRGISLSVACGEILGFLGPNGAGKTTTLRMLTTLLPIDSGHVRLAGFDLKAQPREVRRRVGYVSQLGGADLSATGRENLMLAGQLYGLSHAESGKRVEDLAATFELGELLPRIVRTYSGGQKRRLEVALSMIHRPEILFLDEPTTGLDPQSRANLWEQIRRLRSAGTTVFLTTHYLEEADELADRLAIIDYGRIVAEGTPRQLKQQITGDVIVIQPKAAGPIVQTIQQALAGQPYVHTASVQNQSIHLYVEDGAKSLPLVFDRLKTIDADLEAVSLSQPSLDDVFLEKTGRSMRDNGAKEGIR
jgi:ABC-2 type transport system ATP-binding protein